MSFGELVGLAASVAGPLSRVQQIGGYAPRFGYR
jgi:hypothetical protein